MQITTHQAYVNKMAKQISAGDLAGAAETHEAWANNDWLGCTKGLFAVEAKVGKQVYRQYDEYCDENM